eukprot:GFYU01006139.1.p1 GENE.GFYU01006139.1~~GFYU01006139.1.p1  ORF type:complete len:114 (-),score=15.32 GFYU01006139.1:128-469(-)
MYLVLSFFLPGLLHYWLRNWGRGVMYTLTWNLIGFGFLWDCVSMPTLIVQAKARQRVSRLTCCCCEGCTCCECCGECCCPSGRYLEEEEIGGRLPPPQRGYDSNDTVDTSETE